MAKYDGSNTKMSSSTEALQIPPMLEWHKKGWYLLKIPSLKDTIP